MATKQTTQEEKVGKLIKKWKSWKNDLEQYHPQMRDDQQMYEFSKDENSLTSSDVSTNTTFAIIEGMVSKSNETDVKINVSAKNGEEVYPFDKITASLTQYAISDPDVEALVGTFRDRKEMFERDFYVKGNAAGEMRYVYKQVVEDGEIKTVADNPAFVNLDLFSVVFDPSTMLSTSNEYFVEKNVYYDQLESLKKTKDGLGIYDNLSELAKYKDSDVIDSTEFRDQNYSGSTKINKKVKPIHILEYWNGAMLTVIADKRVIIREEYDPFKIGRHNLVLAMNYVQTGRPYAYGELDPIYKTVRAQDTVLNQSLEVVNQFLKPSVIIQPGAKINLQSLIAVMEEGGVAYGDPKAIGNIPRITPPQQAFLSIDTLQQVIERTSRFSPYSSGIPNTSTDKTQGTMGGILAMQEAAQPNFDVKIDKLRDSFMRVVANLTLKMMGKFTSQDEVKTAIITGTNPQVVKATKGILNGTATLKDLILTGIVDEQEALSVTSLGVAPDQTIAFDVDWVVTVDMDAKTKRQKALDIDKKMQLIKFGMEMGAQFSPDRVIEKLSRDMDMEDFDKLLLNQQEIQQNAMMAASRLQENGMNVPMPGQPQDMAGSPNPEAQEQTQIPTSITPETTAY